MPIDARIPLMVQPWNIQPPDLVQPYMQAMQLKQLQGQQQLTGLKVDEAQRQEADRVAMRDIYARHLQPDPATGQPTLNREGALADLYKINPELGMKMESEYAEMGARQATAQAAQAKSKLETRKMQLELLGKLYGAVREAGYTQEAYDQALTIGAQYGLISPDTPGRGGPQTGGLWLYHGHRRKDPERDATPTPGDCREAAESGAAELDRGRKMWMSCWIPSTATRFAPGPTSNRRLQRRPQRSRRRRTTKKGQRIGGNSNNWASTMRGQGHCRRGANAGGGDYGAGPGTGRRDWADRKGTDGGTGNGGRTTRYGAQHGRGSRRLYKPEYVGPIKGRLGGVPRNPDGRYQ